jgi:hypothetical protein
MKDACWPQIYDYFMANAQGPWLELHAGLHALKALISYCSLSLVNLNLGNNIDPLLSLIATRPEAKVRKVVAAILQKICQSAPNLLIQNGMLMTSFCEVT